MVILDLGVRSEVNSEVRRSFWSRLAKYRNLKVFEKIRPEVKILISGSECDSKSWGKSVISNVTCVQNLKSFLNDFGKV